MKRKSTMHNSTDESQARRSFPRKAPGSRTFQTKHSCLRLFGADRKNVDGVARESHVFSHLFNSPSLFFVGSKRKNLVIVRLSYSLERRNIFENVTRIFDRKRRRRRRRRKDKRRVQKHNLIFQLPKQLGTTTTENSIHPLPSKHHSNKKTTHEFPNDRTKEPFRSLYKRKSMARRTLRTKKASALHSAGLKQRL